MTNRHVLLKALAKEIYDEIHKDFGFDAVALPDIETVLGYLDSLGSGTGPDDAGEEAAEDYSRARLWRDRWLTYLTALEGPR